MEKSLWREKLHKSKAQFNVFRKRQKENILIPIDDAHTHTHTKYKTIFISHKPHPHITISSMKYIERERERENTKDENGQEVFGR